MRAVESDGRIEACSARASPLAAIERQLGSRLGQASPSVTGANRPDDRSDAR